ncbi:hypothetical protein BDP27DRAFT_1343338, partial [Rhodocollybia butyracea]
FAFRDLKDAPLLMTTICRHWRRVAIDTPMLWSSLHIHLPSHLSEEVASQRTTGMSLWLERSATLPISISFHGSSRYNESTPTEFVVGVAEKNLQLRSSKNMRSFMQSLQRFYHRIRRLHLCLSPEDFRMLNSFLQPSTSFPALISLKLDNYSYSHTELVLPSLFLEFFKVSRMPALRSIEFNQGSGWPDAGNSTDGWPMNILISQYMPLSFLYSIVMQNQLLQSLQIGLSITTEDNISLPTVGTLSTLTHLTSLSLDLQTDFQSQDPMDMMYSRMSPMFSLMDSPSLKSLYVRYNTDISLAPQPPFHVMSWTNLETLGLHFPLTPEALTDCLMSVPNITSLHFVDMGNMDDLDSHCITTILQDTHLYRLGLPAGNPSSLCPKLRHIRMIDYESWSSTALADFLEARVRSKALDSFDFLSYKPMQSFLEPQLGRFVRLKEEWGLKLHLHQRF